jgi:DNA-binding GntR family transcriptional regulator
MEEIKTNKAVLFDKPKSMVETVADYLRKSIIHGDLKPNEKINLSEMTEKLGVSNIPLREALRDLEHEGLIFSVPGKGNWVTNVSHKDVEESFVVREMLETFAIELISRKAKTGADFKERLEAIAGKTEGPKFHDALILLAENEKLFDIYNTLSMNIHRYQNLSFNILKKNTFDILEHRNEHSLILEALMKGNFEVAKLKLSKHLETVKNELLKYLGVWD